MLQYIHALPINYKYEITNRAGMFATRSVKWLKRKLS
jgi:predicted Mrr-cat superfamily restriction endonuclease